MNKSWELFKSEILALKSKRNHKIKNSLGVYDAYKYIRKNRWLDLPRPVTEHEFYSIIRTINNYLANNLLLGYDIKFPNKMGKLELRKFNAKIKFKDGKLINNLPIDWDKTLKLWFADKEAKNNKTIIKLEETEIFKVCYNKLKANYNNKTFYDFKINRQLKNAIKLKIKNGELDAFIKQYKQ